MDLEGKSIVIHCDNLAVVNAHNSGRAWDKFPELVARNVWLITTSQNIDLTVSHIPGVKNRRGITMILSPAVVCDLLRYKWTEVPTDLLTLNNTI